MPVLRKASPLSVFLVGFATVFLVLFPKGGIKIGILPITWGYVFFGVTTPFLAIVRLVSFPLRLPLRVFGALAFLIPFQLLVIYTTALYGYLNPPFAISTLTNLFPLPFIFLLLYPPFYPFIDGAKFARLLRICIFVAAVWGIFLFIWHPLTGHYVEIPYLTVNKADLGMLEDSKSINRGFFFKNISTYNNGNLYGLCMLMLAPL